MRLLGILGVVPFVLASLGSLFFDDLLLPLSQRGFLVYSLAILCFLAGTLWGEALPALKSGQRATILISNGVVLFAVFATLAGQLLLTALLLMLGYMALFWFERNLLERERWYTRLRGWLTSAVVVSHMTFAIGLLWRAPA